MALGVNMPKIAQQLGNITESAARKLGRRALIAQAAELRAAGSFEAALALYLTQVNMLLSVWMPKALAGDEKGADLTHKYLSMVADVWGFKTMPRDFGKGDDDGPADEDLVKAVLDRLEQLNQRLTPTTIDGDVVDNEEEVSDVEASAAAQSLGGPNPVS